MSGIKPKLDLQLSAKILRPSSGRWSILEEDRSWEDFDNCRATAVRCVRVGWRLRRCWVTVKQSEVGGFAALMAYGLRGASQKHTYSRFTLYATDPRLPGGQRACANLGGGLTIPRRLPAAYKEAMGHNRRK